MITSKNAVAVAAVDEALMEAADQLAGDLGLARCVLPCADYPYVLTYSAEHGPARLELRAMYEGAPGPVYVDLVAGAMGYRARHGSRNKEPLARAVGLKGGRIPAVLDATAGLGRDAFVLASLGCSVTLVERSIIIAALLRDGLARAAADPDCRAIAQRMQMHVGDAAAIMEGYAEGERPEVVYLDPMYPHSGKSALVKKDMRLLRALVGEDSDAPRLLHTALQVARKRVVVKRPRLAPSLPGSTPSHTLTGRTTRFDIYLCAPPAVTG